MNYVVSNLYGDWGKYTSILKQINFSKDDMLFVLGDIVDGGNKGIEILKDMMFRANVYPILGDHDYIAYEVLSGILEETRDDITAPLSAELADRCREWSERGGEGTLEGFAKLSEEDKEAIIEYMEEFTLYEEVEAGGMDYVLCHSMPESFFTDDDMDDYTAEEILAGKIDYEKDYFFGKVLVSADDVTDSINPALQGRIFKNEYHVAINCGECTAVYCLDTGEEIYVS